MQNIKKEMLAWAIAHGDLFCAKTALSLPKDKLLDDDFLSRFSYLIFDDTVRSVGVPPRGRSHGRSGTSSGADTKVDEGLLQREQMVNEGFSEALAFLTDEMLDTESLSDQILSKIAQNALLLKKFSFASKAYDELGQKNQVISDYMGKGDSLLEEGKIQQATESYLIAAKLTYDYKEKFGPNFQQRGLQLHADCISYPQNCITASTDIQNIIDEGIKYLIDNQEIAEKLLQQPAPAKKSLFKAFAQLQDSNYPAFAENYKAAVQKLKAATQDYKEEKISDEFRMEEVQKAEEGHKSDKFSAEELEYIKKKKLLEDNWEKVLEVQRTLLGRAIVGDNFLQYIRELLWEHPVSALMVCVKYEYQSNPVVTPALQDSTSLMELLELG